MNENTERNNRTKSVAAAIVGGTFVLVGLSRRSGSGLALAATGGAIAYLGTRNRGPHQLSAEASVLLNCTPAEAYQFWRDFENLPRFMNHLESVTTQGTQRSHWVARGPLGTSAQWDAEIVEERENEYIAWHSTADSDLEVEGIVEFRSEPANRGTRLSALMTYRPAGGPMQKALTRMLTKYPKFAMQQDLRRFKALIETGEIPTTEGQSHGPRTAMVGALRTADPDRPIRTRSETKEVLTQKRRIA